MKALLCGLLSIMCMSVANAADLRASAAINITSDTAAAAKNIAMAEARRQIISDVLGQYAERSALNAAMGNADTATLTGLIASTEIDKEQTSDTTYSANITMVLDDVAARAWLVENGVQNWLPDGGDGNKFVVLVNLKNPIANIAELYKIARDENINFDTRYIYGPQMTIEIPVGQRADFTIAIRENGWHYSNVDGALRIWK